MTVSHPPIPQPEASFTQPWSDETDDTERCFCGAMNGLSLSLSLSLSLGSLCGQSLFGSKMEKKKKKAPLFSSGKKGRSQKSEREKRRVEVLRSAKGNLLMCEKRAADDISTKKHNPTPASLA